eukprot:CAMPEP_0175588774 /NCGR_PEP_ID=MMETSP0096-20121207/51465_1 /TAXON_ID=311494 /ORGANISM="Alexandrium monilatum, Strain CCMP3105" /LENGTH=675 /DNA_ID=CAMNT_0016892767 /DNA_START=35 /DNA_END=2061 /DNA_ORIENTATION=+
MPTGQERLYLLLVSHPYLEEKHHQLNEALQDVRQALDTGNGDAEDQMDRIEFELESEEKTLAAAYKRFDREGKGKLDKADMKIMSAYLGFPHQDADIEKLMKAIDTDATGFITFGEFCQYVGRMGGSMMLFQERRKAIAARGGFSEGEDGEDLKLSLKECGIDEEAQAYWRLVVGWSEFKEAGRLVNCQKQALTHIRRLAKKNHQDALPKVQQRILNMGFKDENLWMTLAWIRELAPIIVHVNIDKMVQFMEKDTHYRNQFETKSSGGLLKPEVRTKWERDLFGGCYDKAKGFDRCKYGVQNVMNDYRGVVRCAQYGDSYMVLKGRQAALHLLAGGLRESEGRAPRCAGLLRARAQRVLRPRAQRDAERRKLKGRCGARRLLARGLHEVQEAQIHGEVCFPKHVERLVAHTRHRKAGQEDRIRAVCSLHGWAFSWMDEEQARMKREDTIKMAGSTWEDRLATLEKSGVKIEVPEGYCRVGCGRKVHPGTTRSGRPFTTCCKGCIMGFGHDSTCGKIDESKVGPGKCKHGCGRAVAIGRDSKGRPLDTCCRGCALGLAHDEQCGKSVTVEEGMCIKGCGRPVAEGSRSNGQPWTTCCRGCAKGHGHSQDCKQGASAPTRTATGVSSGTQLSSSSEQLQEDEDNPRCSRSQPANAESTQPPASPEDSSTQGCNCTVL